MRRRKSRSNRGRSNGRCSLPAASTPRRLTRGLRFRLAVSYAIFFTLIGVCVGVFFHQTLGAIFDAQNREALQQEWAALKGYLHIEKGRSPVWFYDREDPDESAIVGRLRRVYLVADATGHVIEGSELYASLGVDSPAEIQQVIGHAVPVWRMRTSPQGTQYLIRGGVVYDEKHKAPYYVAIGRPLGESHRVLEQFTWRYVFFAPAVILGACLLGWFLAGRGLQPVKDIARAAQRISGSNLSLRIPTRGAGDELDYLITTFNRMIERLDSSFAQIKQFSTDVSHELRTPITAIRGQLEVAMFTATSVEQYREAILNALQDTERLSQIVRALLLLSQAESGQMALQKVRLDVSALVRDVADQFQIPAEVARVRLRTEIAPGCEAILDRVQMERLVSNLLSNAIKFTPADGEVSVSLVSSGDVVRLVVADTGRGIAPEHLPHIFDRFYRVPDSGPGEKGLGLGLSFVSWIVNAHGGTIDVESEPGRGTRLTVELPSGLEGSSTAELAPEALRDLRNA